jgi:uncharacterized membrane protein YhaH (DUF805 family)
VNFTKVMFSFEGRIGRQQFWIGTLIIWGASIVLLIALLAAMWQPLMEVGQDPTAWEEAADSDPIKALQTMGPMISAILIYLLFQIAIIWPSLALCVKRLHDRDQSGWWVMLFVGDYFLRLIPVLGLLTWFGFRIYWLVNLGILEGTRGPNRYGPSPRPDENSEIFT